MIIGENFNENNYYGYEEENYDYLFKRKSKEERQQKRAERKQGRTEKKQAKQAQKAEKKASNPKKTILGNFGLFNKNKKKEKEEEKKKTGASGTPAAATGESGNLLSSLKEKAEGLNLPLNDASTPETSNPESQEKDSSNKPKEAGFGPMLGFAFLGITLLVVGVAIYKSDKKSQQVLQPMKMAA